MKRKSPNKSANKDSNFVEPMAQDLTTWGEPGWEKQGEERRERVYYCYGLVGQITNILSHQRSGFRGKAVVILNLLLWRKWKARGSGLLFNWWPCPQISCRLALVSFVLHGHSNTHFDFRRKTGMGYSMFCRSPSTAAICSCSSWTRFSAARRKVFSDLMVIASQHLSHHYRQGLYPVLFWGRKYRVREDTGTYDDLSSRARFLSLSSSFCLTSSCKW